jgi:His-Xaa-Ser system protein HxsD
MATVELSFDASAHTLDAIQRAAYRFCDRFSIDLRREEDAFICTLFFPDDQTATEGTIADFRSEVLDQVLRERIRAETEGTRNLILALAFSKTDLATE